MHTKFSLIILFIALIGCKQQTPIESVDPFIGTDFHGHTYPGATTPFGAVQLSPDTRRGNWDACSGYHYSDSVIYGFSHTHLSGTGAIDLGDILIHPTTLPLNLKAKGYIFSPHTFSHQEEGASPGYYRVSFTDDAITAELTATPHVGVHRYTFPESSDAKLVVDLHHSLDNEAIEHLELKQLSESEIAGARVSTGWTPKQHIYFVARFSKPFKSLQFVSDGKLIDSLTHLEGDNLQAIVNYETQAGEVIEVELGTSLVSIENALENLNAETDGFDFDGKKLEAEKSWADALSAVQVKGGTEEQQQVFYTALYHAMVVPNVTSDVNGQYRTHDGMIKSLPQGQRMYSTLSLWDTFRTWHPLMTLINEELTEDIIRSMLAMYEATGELPIWPLSSGETGTMIGYHSVSVIADAYLKGIRGFDAEKAFEAMKVSSNSSRKGGKYYVQNGFIPANIKKESVSCLLEYAYDDWCIAQMAKALGHESDCQEYMRRAKSYVNVFDGSTGFFRGKREDGNWENPFNPFEAGRAYTEANAWQYRFAVPHDVNGLIQQMGGNELFSKALNDLFSESGDVLTDIPDITGLIGQYAHGNEPSHHMAYLYCYIGQPWKTQEMVRQILQEMYSTQPDGIVGNEDCGQMSAWYLMSSLGLYPVTPGSGEYVLTAPLFPEASIQLHNGKALQIKANEPKKNTYIKSVKFNGQAVDKTFIMHEILMQGGVLEFELDSQPNKNWGVKTEERPYSMSAGQQVSVPYVKNDLHYFIDEINCELGCRTAGAEIRYTLDGSEPNESSAKYEKPFRIDRDMKLTARAFKAGYKPSPVFSVQAVKAVFRKADRQSATHHGVTFKYYEGEFSTVDDLASAPVVKKGFLDKVSIQIAEREDDFGLEFNGYIAIPEDGVYEFYTESDDGSTLAIGDATVVYNDGSHAAIRATGRIPLKEGLHRFQLRYFEDYEGQKLDWGWKKAGEEKWQAISKESLYVRN